MHCGLSIHCPTWLHILCREQAPTTCSLLQLQAPAPITDVSNTTHCVQLWIPVSHRQ